jgi:hypothetical protein
MTEKLNKICGIRTDAWDGEKTKVELTYEIYPYDSKYAKPGELVFHLYGGPTGYESFVFIPNDGTLDRMKITGWHACGGTEKRWDSLFIPPEEIQKIIL